MFYGDIISTMHNLLNSFSEEIQLSINAITGYNILCSYKQGSIIYCFAKNKLSNIVKRLYITRGSKMTVQDSKINGITLKKMMISAASNLEQTKEELNAINVFPIPDGDTGVNLFLTMRTVVEQFDEIDPSSINEAAQLITKGSFLGAKGNSGVIISQFFQGFSSEIENHEEVGIDIFAKALEAGCEWSYEAVLHPTEGTILTVIKDTAAIAKKIAEKGGNWNEMITETYSTAVVSLENTPNLLPCLKEAGVVDAGAMGFVNVWLGWCFQLMDSLGIKITHIEEEYEKMQNGE